MQWSPTVGKIGLAISKIQAELRPAKKDSTNPFFKSRYADLESVWEAIRDLCATHEVAVIQMPGTLFEDGEMWTTLDTMLIHSSGEYVQGCQPLFLKSQDPQAQGSAITYARRYCLAACLGVVQSDDDGEGAQNAQREVQKSPPKSGTTKTITSPSAGETSKPKNGSAAPAAETSKSVTADLQDEDLIAAAEGNGWTEQAARAELAGLLDKFGQNNGRAMAAGKFSKGPVAK